MHWKRKHRFKKNFIPLLYSVYITAIFFILLKYMTKNQIGKWHRTSKKDENWPFFTKSGSSSFVRKCRESWLARATGRRVYLRPGTSFLHIKGALSLTWLCKQTTIMDKSIGTVVQFERFLTHAKLDPRATNTVRPYPLPPPHGQGWNRQGTISLLFQH